MGLLITSCLITWNIYGALDAPPSRGFSHAEIWIAGMQGTILLAILEYLTILFLIRKRPFCSKMGRHIKYIDYTSFLLSIVFFTIFNVIYWF